MARIEYNEKANARTSVLPAANKFGAAEANEIKASVNALYDIIISSDNLTIADSLSDFPDPVAGVVTIPDGASYLITTSIDFVGNRIVLSGDAAFAGLYTSISRMTSTGLGATVPFITSLNGVRFSDIEIYDVGTALSLDASATSSAIDWRDVNFRDVTEVGTINTYDNIILETLAFLNSGTLTFEGTFGTIAFLNTLFDTRAGDTMLAFDASVVITRRIRIENSAFVILSDETGINLPVTVTIPDERYTLNTVNFAGGGTYITGVQYDDDKALFKNCGGIDNSNSIGGLSILNNATETVIATSGVAVAVAGTSTGNALNQRFTLDAANNALEYNNAISGLFVVTATISLTSGNNKNIGVYIARSADGTINAPTDIITTSENYTNTDGTRPETLTVQSFVELDQGNKIYIALENDSDTTNITVKYMNLIVQKAVS